MLAWPTVGTWSLILSAHLVLAIGEAPSSHGATDQALLFFTRPDKRVLDEALLLDAVGIYTRDLGLGVRRAPEPHPELLTPATTNEVAAVLQARGGRLGFWVQGGTDGHTVELIVVDPRKVVVRQTFVYDTPGADLYRALALKLRVVAVGSDIAAPAAAASPAPTPGTGALPAAGAGAGIAPIAGSQGRAGEANTVPASSDSRGSGDSGRSRDSGDSGDSRDLRARAASSEPRDRVPAGAAPHRFQVAAGFALSVPSGSARWRQAAALHAIARVRSHAEGDVGIELARPEASSTAAGTLTVMDVPLRVGARVGSRGPEHFVGLGVTGGVHFLYASARELAPSTGLDRTWALAASAGLEVLARTPAVYGLAPEFRLWIEVNAPRTRFVVRGVSGFDAGIGNVGFSAGIAFPSP